MIIIEIAKIAMEFYSGVLKVVVNLKYKFTPVFLCIF